MTESTHRMAPDARKQHILNAAVDLAKTEGYLTLTRGSIASHAGISPALITFYFYSIRLLLDAVMEEAVSREIPCIIAEGLARKHPHAVNAPLPLRQAAIAVLSGV